MEQLPYAKRSANSLIGLNQLLSEVVPWSRTILFARLKEDKFPQPIRSATIGRGLVWRVGDVRAWVEAQQAAPAPKWQREHEAESV